MKKYISEVIKGAEFDRGAFNVIASGTGTGKTEFVRTTLLEILGNVEPSEILYVTSRSMIRDQQSTLDGINRFGGGCNNIVNYWNGDTNIINDMERMGIWIMNYSQLIYILDYMPNNDGDILRRIKVAVFDECHALVSDRFISAMSNVRIFLRERVIAGSLLAIGLTATPEILKHDMSRIGVPIRIVNDEYIINYKAKHLYCARFESLPDLLSELGGKSMIMCVSLKDCYKLKEQLKNSVVLCSCNNPEYSDEMKGLRQYIVEHNELPPTTDDVGISPSHPIDVLITTSTMREGVNLNEYSGIKNVVSCMPDELHVTQFLGRCRFDVENLIVANTRIRPDNTIRGVYLEDQRNLYRAYVKNKTDTRWYDTISKIVDVPFEGIVRYRLEGGHDSGFVGEVESMWTSTPTGVHKIFKSIDGEAIISMGKKYRIFGGTRKRYSFVSVMEYIESLPEFDVVIGRCALDNGIREVYRIIYRKKENENA